MASAEIVTGRPGRPETTPETGLDHSIASFFPATLHTCLGRPPGFWESRHALGVCVRDETTGMESRNGMALCRRDARIFICRIKPADGVAKHVWLPIYVNTGDVAWGGQYQRNRENIPSVWKGPDLVWESEWVNVRIEGVECVATGQSQRGGTAILAGDGRCHRTCAPLRLPRAKEAWKPATESNKHASAEFSARARCWKTGARRSAGRHEWRRKGLLPMLVAVVDELDIDLRALPSASGRARSAMQSERAGASSVSRLRAPWFVQRVKLTSRHLLPPFCLL